MGEHYIEPIRQPPAIFWVDIVNENNVPHPMQLVHVRGYEKYSIFLLCPFPVSKESINVVAEI